MRHRFFLNGKMNGAAVIFAVYISCPVKQLPEAGMI